MNELYEELHYLVVTGQDQENATLAALHDVAMDLNMALSFQSCTRCRAMCDPVMLSCHCPPDEEHEEDHDLRPEERWCNQCGVAFDEDLHGPWCPHCFELELEYAPEEGDSPIQVIPNEEPQQFPVTEDDDLPF